MLSYKKKSRQSAVNHIKTTNNILNDLRSNNETKFKDLYSKASEKMKELDTTEKKQRITKTQQHRPNPTTDIIQDYFCITMYIPFLDYMVHDLNSRFTEETLSLYNLGIFVPKILISTTHDKEILYLESIWEQFGKLEGIRDQCKNKEDFIIKLQGEVLWWREQWKNKNKIDIPSTALDALKNCDKDILPIIHSHLSILSSFPVSVASAERSFSSLRRTKSWLRTITTEERLSGLALIHCHRDINIDIDEVIDIFSKETRKKDFVI